MKIQHTIMIILLASVAFAQKYSGDEILDKVDEGMTAQTKIFVAKMIVHGRRGSRTIESKSWVQGTEKSFTEYLAPAREKGTKMLKLGDQLWTYSPQTDRIIKIAGHILRQSLMGSDLSYEDMMEDPHLNHIYTAQVTGEEMIADRPCWVLQLTAKTSHVAYHTRKIWVDKERFIILREYRFAKSGKLLKTTDITDVFQVDGRWYPKRILFKDQLRKGKGTEFILESIKFNSAIPSYLFSKATLRK
ncbi:MAG: outer membrane lipoprotein-sorting protein [Calditrichaeota bacterium]|nr:outer membrane lipoprotein-sorting protein [Calditrichota bacterium]